MKYIQYNKQGNKRYHNSKNKSEYKTSRKENTIRQMCMLRMKPSVYFETLHSHTAEIVFDSIIICYAFIKNIEREECV